MTSVTKYSKRLHLPGLTAKHGAFHLPATSRLGVKRKPCVQAKCELEDEVRVVHLASHMGYAELLQSARAKFPGAPPFVIKYLDRCAANRGLHAPLTWLCKNTLVGYHISTC